VLATWRRGIAAVAECPNVNLKLGGIGMPRLGFDWHTRSRPIGSEELATSIAPIMSYCIEQFGPNRCMFESNFPVDKVSFSHHVLFNALNDFRRAIRPLSAPLCFTIRQFARIGLVKSDGAEQQNPRRDCRG
jgi:predicted TIM-barrel fold metal-dependent hydrolase